MKKIAVGQYWEVTEGFFKGGIYFLCIGSSPYDVLLVDLQSGEKWNNAVEVNDIMDISQEEWHRITGGRRFTRITNKHVIEITEL